MYKLDLFDGEYTVVLNETEPYQFKALRYGEEWKSLTGDNLILALVYKIQELEEKLNSNMED